MLLEASKNIWTADKVVFSPKSYKSRMFNDFPSTLMKRMEDEDSTSNIKFWGVLTSKFDASSKLNSFFDLLAT